MQNQTTKISEIQQNLIRLTRKIMDEIKDEELENINHRNFDCDVANKMLNVISHIECELQILLAYTTEIGGFCRTYPVESLKLMKICRDILNLELRSEN